MNNEEESLQNFCVGRKKTTKILDYFPKYQQRFVPVSGYLLWYCKVEVDLN